MFLTSSLSGWGRYPRVDCTVARCREDADLSTLLRRPGSLIARGNGRAYADCALNPDMTALLRTRDRIRSFDPQTGRLTCDAGVLLSDLLDVFVPRGWFPPVTPGTRLVTIGGMIAADVHGKNHHSVGSFGNTLEGLHLMGADGTVLHCSPTENTDLFRATVGGMGLTGIILDATFCLQPIESAYIRQEILACGSLDDLMAGFEDSRDWTYSVAWIDGVARGAQLGRGLLMRGEHATLDDLPLHKRDIALKRPIPHKKSVPFDFPGFALNRFSVSAFNTLYYSRGAMQGGKETLTDLDTYFYPLDAIMNWNRVYGRRGFMQYQCVLPRGEEETLRTMLQTIAADGNASFLAVLKLFGPSSPEAGFLSFPQEGFTLALDFPVRPRVFHLLDTLDQLIAKVGGHVYLAKDARAKPEAIVAGYPNLGRFRAVRRDTGADARFSSCFSKRVGI